MVTLVRSSSSQRLCDCKRVRSRSSAPGSRCWLEVSSSCCGGLPCKKTLMGHCINFKPSELRPIVSNPKPVQAASDVRRLVKRNTPVACCANSSKNLRHNPQRRKLPSMASFSIHNPPPSAQACAKPANTVSFVRA